MNQDASQLVQTRPCRGRVTRLAPDPEWYKDAIIYQLHVKAFQDSEDNGIGDFRGLISRLDYIEALGATAIWLLPFYPSPLRDDGYDISDYRRINPAYGDMRDFRRLVREAHHRGLRVITELVINHTSDQHPWFQKARRAKPGSAAREFYVWSDTDQRYQGTRIIFLDTETSNWTWDPVAKAYYWHRFYSHQPDLNFDNPRVLSEMIKTMRRWLDVGVDGLRLDAIPYLIEREGTNNENLPETHEVLKAIRGVLDRDYDDRLLLAEANQWPEDTAPYFGDGDECHMAFHFPLMPRMYMAVAQEDRHPVTDIIRQMPEIPSPCQWAIFLRNHDELTLEMVTEEERDYLWRTYAEDAKARINLGIRRRLAPLMQNDRRKIELMNGLLLSMPGTPILYYGDEIGMGDNYYLGDRDGVRTPMQWTADRNAGFSRANPQQLYLPPVMDPIYGYQSINVESQDRDPSSLLNWMRRILAVRAQHPVFGRGDMRFLYPRNRKILAYVRTLGDEKILCVANLARSAQAVELDLEGFRGAVPVELSGQTPFPPIGELPYLLTLPGYGFYWFRLEEAGEVPSWHEPPPEVLPEFVTLTAPHGAVGDILVGRERRLLERDILPSFLPLQRWFAGKGSRIKEVGIRYLGARAGTTQGLTILDVETDGAGGRYFLPLQIRWGAENLQPGNRLLSHTLARARRGARLGAVVDAAFDDDFARDLMALIWSGEDREVIDGKLEIDATDRLRSMPRPAEVRRTLAEQSNVSAILDESIILKIYRALKTGPQPDVEVGRFLTETAGYPNTPAYLGAVTLRNGSGDCTTLASAFAFVPNQGDAWEVLLEALSRDLEAHCAITADTGSEKNDFAFPLDIAPVLGRRTAELHAAFATSTTDPGFRTRPVGRSDLDGWSETAAQEIRDGLSELRAAARYAGDDLQAEIRAVLAAEPRLLERIARVARLDPVGDCTRIHGDLHLGQVLISKNDVFFVDFEGEPQREIEERRLKTSPLRDVAGIVRSFDYLAQAVMARIRDVTGTLSERQRERAIDWRSMASRAFLESYLDASRGAMAEPENRNYAICLLDMFVLQKAVYELRYEASHRPAWLFIPIRGLLDIVNEEESPI